MIILENYQNLINIAIQAGDIIMDIRKNKQLDINIKHDNSPVTFADHQSNVHITQELHRHYPNIPIISEESENYPIANNDIFFLIDPLDGTRDFIEGTDDYCVNIALVYQNMPVLGIIYIPQSHECYYGVRHQGSYKIPDCGNLKRQTRLSVKKVTDSKTQIISKRSNNMGYCFFDPLLNIQNTRYAGSAKKFCFLADGQADIYPRPGQTGEWDTAAGDIIVTEAGGFVRDKHHNPLIYGKKDYLNDAFYASNFLLNQNNTYS